MTSERPYPKRFSLRHSPRRDRGVSPIISTIILTSALLVILVVASYVSTNILIMQMDDSEFEQAKTNMSLLDNVIQDVALRPGAGGYVQFNERAGGIGINQSTNSIKVADNQGKTLGSWSSLLTLVYHAGSQVSGAATNITGTSQPSVSMSDPLGFLRVEVGQGVWVKLDYNRVRTVSMGALIVNNSANNSAYNFYDITMISLTKGDITATSGTVNARVQSLPINTTSYTYASGVTVTAKLNNGQPQNLIRSSGQTVVMITTIPVRVSIG